MKIAFQDRKSVEKIDADAETSNADNDGKVKDDSDVKVRTTSQRSSEVSPENLSPSEALKNNPLLAQVL